MKTLTTALFLLISAAFAPAAEKPNVLFILVDDLAWADLGYNGSTVYETPNVDRLADEGMVFSDFYSGGPVCSPTRASILTGKYTARIGITTYLLSPDRDAAHVTPHLPLEEFTIAEALQKNGYATGYFGKWHLGYKNEHWAANQGFEVAKGGLDIPWAWTLCYPEREAPTAKTWRKGHTRFFSPHHLTHLENGPEGEYLTDRLTNETIAFIEEERDEPFLAFLSFHTVHTPLEAKPEVVEKYRRKISSLGLDEKKETDRREKRFQNLPEYAAMVHHMDENVGRLLDRLDEMGIAKDTIVVFTSDNGGKGSVTSNLPLRGMKHNLYEGGIRVPTIVRWPGRVEAGVKNGTPLISNDFYPTLLELSDCPPEPEQHVDGVSFKAILTGEADTVEREAIYWHYPHSRQEAAVRQGKFKLLHRFEKDTIELYDLEADIGERSDLSEAEPEVAGQMLTRLKAWQESVGARFAKPKNPPATGQAPASNKEPRKVTVFERDDTHGYRIPSLVTAANGDLLAFIERRVGLHDHAKNDIVMRRSNDLGATWKPIEVISDEGGDSLNDPCVTILKNGDVLLVYQRFPEGVHARASGHTVMAQNGYDGPENTRTYVMRSKDHGKTWDKARDITRQVRRKSAISVGSPGRGIQLSTGPNIGRIIIPLYETNRLGDNKRDWDNSVAYSDDNGETWELSEQIPRAIDPGFGNEAQVVELADGRVLMSSRNQGGEAFRLFSTSPDGGQTWRPERAQKDLVTPACMSSVLRYDGSTLLHSLPNSKSGRKNGAIFVSRDGGTSWPVSRVIEEGAFGYSCLTRLGDGTIGCLYEAGGYQQAKFVRFSLEWILEEKSPRPPPSVNSGKNTEQPDLTIIAFGDSTTALRRTIDRVYADRLPDLLNAKGLRAKVINAGVSGSHSGRLVDNTRHKRKHALDRFDDAVRAHDPDVAIVQFGINDSWVDSDDPGDGSRIPLKAYEKNMRHIVTTLQAEGTRVILMTPNALGKRFEEWRHERLAGYAATVRRIADDLDVELIDADALFAEPDGGTDSLLLDGTHPNDDGHELIAQAIAGRFPASEQGPNVLFIAVDDWNDWVGCLGHEQAKTPNVDRLAERGMLFTNAHCTVSVCNPSRVAVMTGLRPETTGVFENSHRMRRKVPDLVTLSQHFRQNGYRVEGGGKVYHDVPPFCHDPESWDDYFWWSEHGPKGGKSGGSFRSPYSIPPDPEPVGRPTRKITALTKRNFDWGPVDQDESDWPDYQVAEWAAKFLTQPQEKPFFLAVGIFRPHVPWFNPQKYFDLYPEDEVELPPVKADDVDDLGDWARKRAMDRNSKHDKVVESGEWKGAVRAYLASISHADANVGRVLDALDRGPNKKNTIIVFWSDHGYHLGEKGHWHKRTLWERATHVPLIIAAPDVTEPGARCSRPVNLIDLYPTLIDLCGVKKRKELAGHSLVPLLKDPEASWDHPSITTYLPGNHAVRTDHWRYIRYASGDEELYDHRNDPHEWNNLAGLAEFEEIKNQLASELPPVEK